MDIVWLKRDVRLTDHGPLAEVATTTCSSTTSSRPLLIIYNYEPDQLSEHSVHGSHVCFVNEGLVDLDRKLSCDSDGDGDGDGGDVLSHNDHVSDPGGLHAGGGAVGGAGAAFLVKAGASSNSTSPTTNSIDGKEEDLYSFNVITVCHAGIVFTLNSILRQIKAGTVYVNNINNSTSTCSTPAVSLSSDETSQKEMNNTLSQKEKESNYLHISTPARVQVTGIHRILTHEETGHLKSFARDKAVRKWCRHRNIPIMEYNQTGVTRCLSSRDDFSKRFQKFIQKPLWETPTINQRKNMRSRLVTGLKLHNVCRHPLYPHKNQIQEIPVQHRKDRPQRQQGGETEGHLALTSFLHNRGRHYSSGISSPNTSWTTGGRISPYLTWGHLSTRYVIHMLKRRQEEVCLCKSSNTLNPTDGPFLKSLQAFSSRMHWRSHFIQKLESEPRMEQRDLCSSFQHLRRQPEDWNEDYYIAWKTGHTGYPFVDACMRCLLQHGWLNFRMRAMLVSFATYNLWLDWKRIAPHLARVFLDYEPGIHYPQLQMQAGTTGINAMRVYNVTKQGNDQDPDGVFVKKYVPELRNVPLEYIHEPSRMTRALQVLYKVTIGNAAAENGDNGSNGVGRVHSNGQTEIMFRASQTHQTSANKKIGKDEEYQQYYYPRPIVNEKESAKIAKEKVSQVRKLGSTKRVAEKVYIKHGSRSSRNGNMDGVKPKALSSTIKRVKLDASMESGQSTIHEMFQRVNSGAAGKESISDKNSREKKNHVRVRVEASEDAKTEENSSGRSRSSSKSSNIIDLIHNGKDRNDQSNDRSNTNVQVIAAADETSSPAEVAKKDFQLFNQGSKSKEGPWNCSACTFTNEKPLALSCIICGSLRYM